MCWAITDLQGMILKCIKNINLLLPTLFTLCNYSDMAAYFSSAQNQYHINFPM